MSKTSQRSKGIYLEGYNDALKGKQQKWVAHELLTEYVAGYTKGKKERKLEKLLENTQGATQ